MKSRQQYNHTLDLDEQIKPLPAENHQPASPKISPSMVDQIPEGRGTRKLRRSAAAQLASRIGNRAFAQRVPLDPDSNKDALPTLPPQNPFIPSGPVIPGPGGFGPGPDPRLQLAKTHAQVAKAQLTAASTFTTTAAASANTAATQAQMASTNAASTNSMTSAAKSQLEVIDGL